VQKVKQVTQPYLEQAIASPYSGWVLVNIVVWSLGLYAIAICIRFLGIAGAPIGAILAGLIVGGGQSWVLKRLLPITPRQWTSSSTIGTLLGVLPIGLLFLWVLLVAFMGLNSVLLILGALFGGILGSTQARVLHPIVYEKGGWWIVANIFAGALCAPLSLTGTTFWLPIFCSLGPLTFGLLTAWALRYLLNTLDDEFEKDESY
jgi:hypothetical protein